MALSQRTRKRRAVDVSDDEDEFASPSPAKLRKRTANAPSSDEESPRPKGKGKAVVVLEDEVDVGEENDDEDVGSPAPLERFRPELQRGDDGYVAGSIVRVKIIGFMTYDFVEFRPGPHLNMILGPNGTGKSSIAAAIAIGLGFQPKVMGRAHDVRSYVKQGTEVAEIEVELKGKRGKNQVIRRKFGRDSDKSQYWLNGSSASRNAVQSVVKKFGVQADNLCSFLPQDKVADFAKMEPPTVLKETMRAAGDPHLTQWHEDLVSDGKTALEIESTLKSKADKRDALRRQVEELEPEVRNYEERLELEKQHLLATILVRAAKWKGFKTELVSLKQQRNKATQKLSQTEAKQEPLKQLLKSQEKSLKGATLRSGQQKTSLGGQNGALEAGQRRHLAASRRIEDVDAKLRTVSQDAKAHQKRIMAVEADIRRKEETLATPQEDKDAIRTQLEDNSAAKNKASQERRRFEAELGTLLQEEEGYQNELHQLLTTREELEKREKQLSNVEAQRRARAFAEDPSMAYAVNWIERNQDQLRERVFFPPLISVNVPDNRYAWHVESCLNFAQKKTFICQNQEDYRTMMKLNKHTMQTERGQQGVKLHLACIEVQDAPAPPVDAAMLPELGLDGYALDFIEAEPPVRTFLWTSARMHAAAVSLKPHAQINADRVLQAGIRSWYSSTHSSRATQSQYGNRDLQTVTIRRQDPRFFALSVDAEAIERIKDEMADLRLRQRALEQPKVTVTAKIAECRRKRDEVIQKTHQLDRQIKELRQELHKYDLAKDELRRLKDRLKTLKAMPSPEEKRRELRQELGRYADEGIDAWKQYLEASERVFATSGQLDKCTLLQCQLSTNVHAIEEVMEKRGEKLATLSETVDKVITAYAATKRNMQKQLEELSHALNNVPDDEERRDFTHQAHTCTMSVDDATTRTMELKARLDLSLQVDGNTVDRYHRLKADLDDKELEVSRSENELADVTTRIEEVLAQFNPALDALVQETSEKFSEAFRRVKCAGEVRVRRVEGRYAEWGIEILVSYRDGQPLEVLTASRQSGGERSLATVTYLMSLSEMSRTPFSLVDEINQGMDARAERNVHNQMVQVTCAGGDGAGQYFLITPKLLTDLEYHENMKVLIVNNGTWLPDPVATQKRFGALAECLARYKREHAITI